MPYFLNICSLWSITSTNWLCRKIEMFSPSACILLYVCHFCLTCSHTVVHPHTPTNTLSLPLVTVLRTEPISSPHCDFPWWMPLCFMCGPTHTPCQQRPEADAPSDTHPIIHPSTLLCILPPTCPSTLPNLLSTLFTLYTLFCVAVQCKSHLWLFAATFQTKIKTCMSTTSTMSTLQGLDWF